MLIDSIGKVYKYEEAKPKTDPPVQSCFVSKLTGDGKYALTTVTGRIVGYGVNGERGLKKGAAVSASNISSGFPTISSVPNYEQPPEIETIEV